MTPTEVETADVLGIPVAKLDLERLLDRVRRAARQRGAAPLRIAYVNAQSVNLFCDDPEFRTALLGADLIYADGNGARLAAWLRGDRLPPRMTGADWIHDLCRLCEREGLSLYFLGAAPGIAEEATHRLRTRYPGLRVAGAHHGFFGPGEERSVTEAIRAARPDIVLLAMGSPRQEIWMATSGLALDVPVVWAAGGVLDYASGRVRRAPAWMCRLGLEWLGRLMIEPRRLGGRYVVGLPLFLGRAVRHALRMRS